MKKRVIATILSLALALGVVWVQLPPASAAEGSDAADRFGNIDYRWTPEIRVILDGRQLFFDVPPRIVDGRTLVSMRAIFEAFGLTVNWDEAARTAEASSEETSIFFTIDSDRAMVNGEVHIMDVPPRIIGGRTMIPLRFLSENMGYKVVWIGESNLILLSQADIIEWRYESFEADPPYREYEVKYINGQRTTEFRYTGTFREVEIVTLYSSDGRLVPNVPDFRIPLYGSGWRLQSPFAGRTYWVDIDAVSGEFGHSRFYDGERRAMFNAQTILDHAPVGNYVKVRIDEHYFDLETWRQMGSLNSSLASIQDDSQLDGREIAGNETLFRVTINDRHQGIILLGDLLGTLLEPGDNQIYTIFERDPRTVFDWSNQIWTRLKGQTPWAGMTQDMLLVQLQTRPDQTARTQTRFSVFELWVYEYDYTDTVYFFDGGILTGMW